MVNRVLGRRVSFSYPPCCCLSCGGVARVLKPIRGDAPGTMFGCATCGQLGYAPAFDDQGCKHAGFAVPGEAAQIWAQYPDPQQADIPF